MKVFLLGATGRTGKLILEELLARNSQVNILVRDRNKCATVSPLLQIFEGNPGDPFLLRKAMANCSVLISALNISRNSDFPWSKLRTPVRFLSTTMQMVIGLCKEMSIPRILVISAWGVGDTRNDLPGWFRWTIDHSNILPAYEDHQRQEELLETSNLDWTAVRPVGLTNFKRQPVKVSLNGQPKPSLLISRRSLAHFIVDEMANRQYNKQKPVVFN